MSKISVIIVNYNSGDRLKRCLACLEAQTYRDFETIVIDNDSDDTSLGNVPDSPLTPLIIEAEANIGFAAANNKAALHAAGEWLAFLNPDAYAASDWLEKMASAIERRPDTDAFGSTQLSDENTDIIDGSGDVLHAFGVPYRGNFGWPVTSLPPEGECFAPCAAAALYKKSVFEKLGGFDETFFCYVEDVDLGFRLRLAGGRAIQVRDAVVRHEGSGISGKVSPFTVYHGNRNRIWMFYKNMPMPLLIFLAPFNFLTNVYLLIRSRRSGTYTARWRALRDGYGGLAHIIKARAAVQCCRRVSSLQVAQALTWPIGKVTRREADIRHR